LGYTFPSSVRLTIIFLPPSLPPLSSFQRSLYKNTRHEYYNNNKSHYTHIHTLSLALTPPPPFSSNYSRREGRGGREGGREGLGDGAAGGGLVLAGALGHLEDARVVVLVATLAVLIVEEGGREGGREKG